MISGLLIFILTMTYGLLIMKELGWKILKDWHPIIGFIILIFVGLIVVGGFFVGALLNSLRWRTGLVLKIKIGHRVNFYFK